MKKLYKFLLISVLSSITLFYSCDTLELEQLASPNALSTDQADPDLLLNSIQLSYRGSQRTFQANSADLGRIDYMFGRNYLDNFGDGTLSGAWNSFYSNNLPNLQAIAVLAENPEKDLSYHLGMAKTMQAHTLMQLVDFLGDIPWSEAGNPAEFPKPTVDDDESVYNAAIAMLAEAKAHFEGTTGIGTGTDLFYGGDATKWIKLVNTLQMRANLTTKNYAAVVSATNVIESSEDDFQFNYGTNVLSPDTRHPNYASDYTSSGANIYQSNWLINQMIGAFPYGDFSGSTDPRRRYYFYRQSFNTPGSMSIFRDIDGRFGAAGTAYLYNGDGNGETLSCSLQDAPTHMQFTPDEEIWCSMPIGYWGRVHGNDEGTPPDGFTRTAVGVYPSGGSFDGYPDAAPFIAQYDSNGDYIGYVASINLLYNQAVGLGNGGSGSGVDPIYLASYVDFMKAEANLALGNTAAAATHLEAGMTKSIAKVQSFGALDSSADFSQAPNASDVAGFIANKVADFNGAASQTALDGTGFPVAKDKMDILSEQYFIAIYGGAGDAFNFIRRTGYPRTLARSIDSNPGTFPRTVLYPSSEVSANSNILQRTDLSATVFWDAGVINPSN
tara:strand:+ start:145 stop:1977 length:1833 start_codon:yes stop_codon:yes gene_type:complete